MAKSTLTRAMKLTGTDVAEGKRRVLTAGALSAMLDNGGLRYIRYHGVEVLRGISYLVRDSNWGTYAPAISKLKIRERKDGFTVSYSAITKDKAQGLAYDALIEASATGRLRFSVTATPVTDFVTNRTGFTVLHPLAGVVGQKVEIVHTDGKRRKGRFPKLISPGQPFFELRALTHEVMPGVAATVLMEGNKFEMEDHRNWMDASYKTYVCSLRDPWPYRLTKGAAFTQTITLSLAGKPRLKRLAKPSPEVSVSLGGAKGLVPSIGIGVPMAEAAQALAKADVIAAMEPNHLVCQIDGRQRGQRAAAEAFRQLRAETGTLSFLEIVLPARAPARAEMAVIAKALRAAGYVPDAMVVSQAHDLKSFQPGAPRPWGPSYDEMAAAVRAEFPDVPLGGGMLSYFTELNRKPVPRGVFDFITHTVCPIVHAADDVSVMETLQSMPSIIASARRIIGPGTPYLLGPSAIACRSNPYGAAVAPNPQQGRVCLTDADPRQRGLFAAAWNLGLIAACAQGGLAAVTLGAATGPQGVISAGGALHPAYHLLAGFGPASGNRRLAAVSCAPARVAALAYRTPQGRELWLANLTPEAQRVRVAGLDGGGELHRLSEGNFRRMAAAPDFLWGKGEALRRAHAVALGPYEVVRLRVT